LTEFPTIDGVKVTGPAGDRFDEILSAEALAFVADLQRRFGPRRKALLKLRDERQAALHAGASLDFLPETRDIRTAPWSVAPPAPGLVDRRVEITGPTDRKMAINALNSGAKVWLADFEDANSPLWGNLVEGQLNLRDVLDRRIDFVAADGRSYELGDELATIVARPRGWHLPEKHLIVDGEPVTGALFDFGLYFFHCAQRQVDAGRGPYFYLPKTESHHEARLWNDVFDHAEQRFGMARGTVRATVLIETVPAAFEMDEILFELRDHSGGLNAGRWDYLFSLIKKFRSRGAQFVLPDRNSVTMAAPFMRAYTELLVQTCHRRGAHAIGGMAAFIPSRRDAEVNAIAMAKVREDKEREAGRGFDGSWVAHPDLVPLCREVFDAALGERPHQIANLRDDVKVSASELLDVASTPGAPTEDGLRNDVSVGLQYLAAWLNGLGAVAIFSLMEDVATAEIARSQIWQWIHNDVILTSGEQVTAGLVQSLITEELDKIRAALGGSFDTAAYEQARQLFELVALSDDFVDFLTLPAYERMP
jgi:malate synthase